MKLFQLLDAYGDDAIIEELFCRYPEQIENEYGYRAALIELRDTKPVEDEDMRILVEHIVDDPLSDEPYDSVHGITDNDDTTWSLMLTDWGKWLGMQIDQHSFEKFSALETLAECLYEIAWVGYSNERVREEREKLDNIVDDLKERGIIEDE